MLLEVAGFQGCYRGKHRNNWRCAHAVHALCENAPSVAIVRAGMRVPRQVLRSLQQHMVTGHLLQGQETSRCRSLIPLGGGLFYCTATRIVPFCEMFCTNDWNALRTTPSYRAHAGVSDECAGRFVVNSLPSQSAFAADFCPVKRLFAC